MRYYFRDSKGTAIVLLTTIVWVVACVFRYRADPSFRYAAALFCISAALELILLSMEAPDDGRLVRTLGYAEIFKAALLAFYLFMQHPVADPAWVAWSSLALSACVVTGLALLASRIVYSVRDKLGEAADQALSTVPARRQNLIDEMISTIRRNRLYALSTVLVAFLHVTYFTAFAIAIHDRGGGKDLQANRPAPTRYPQAISASMFSADTARPNEVVTLLFGKTDVTVQCADEITQLLSNRDPRALLTDNGTATLRRDVKCRGTPVTSENAEALLKLYALFGILGATDAGRVLVEVRGHSESSAEVANIRALNAEAVLRRMVIHLSPLADGIEPEWRTYGVAPRSSFLAGDAAARLSGEQQSEIVEVQVIPLGRPTMRQFMQSLTEHDRLDLLDYLYFTIYTITTTGYGDIIPLSPFARFVVSIANLYELFFVAIIFNIVAAAARD